MVLSNQEIIDLYTNHHKSCAEIAFLGHCSETTIYNSLKKSDVLLRDKSEANKKFPDLICVKLYNLGLSVSQIAKVLMVDPSTIVKRLRLLNFPLRSRKTAMSIRYNKNEFNKLLLSQSQSEVT